jgi:hypothetical protein
MATLTTPKMALPYPDGAERVMDGDNAIGALANAIDYPLYRAALPPGAIVYGPSRVMVSSSEKLPLSAVLNGALFFDDANDLLRIPTGADGLYYVWAFGTAQLVTGGGFLRLSIKTAQATAQAGNSPQTFTGAQSYWSMGAVLALAGQNVLSVHADCGGANLATCQVLAFGCVRLGSGFGTPTLLDALAERDTIEALPAPELER